MAEMPWNHQSAESKCGESYSGALAGSALGAAGSAASFADLSFEASGAFHCRGCCLLLDLLCSRRSGLRS